MASKPTLTVLLGAGSTLDLGLTVPQTGKPCGYGMPSTNDLTEAILKNNKSPQIVVPGIPFFFDHAHLGRQIAPFQRTEVVPVISLIEKVLRAGYRQVDFELVLHALEQLEPMVAVRNGSDAADEFRPVLSAFVEIGDKGRRFADRSLINETRRAVLLRIFEKILEAKFRCGKQDQSQKLREMLDCLRKEFRLRVFTLNYDDIVDEAMPSAFDGFESPVDDDQHDDARAFSAREFAERYSHEPETLVHLHGSVRFGRRLSGLVKYTRAERAREAIEGTISSDHQENGTLIPADPIISGLNKSAKLIQNPVPFGYYFRAFIDSIVQSPRLLVIGYGGRDDHINAWLRQMPEIHGDSRRLVWVGKFSGQTCGQRTPEKELLIQVGAARWTTEYKRFEDAEDADFQNESTILRLVANGFPFKSGETVNRAIEFLKT